MGKAKLDFFEMSKPALRIEPLFANEEFLEEIRRDPAYPESLPSAEKYYKMPVNFPRPSDSKPYIVSSIVLSADGKMAFADNPEGPLIAGNNFLDRDGGTCDFWVLNMLRAYSDGILIGANTLRNEPLVTCQVMDIDLNRERREALGKKQHPIQIIVSLDGTDIPFDHRIFNVDEGEGLKVMIATSPSGWDYIKANCGELKVEKYDKDTFSEANLNGDFGQVPVLVTGKDKEPGMLNMLRCLREKELLVLCSESPTYTAALMAKGCLDEYFIDYSLVYAGGAFTPGKIFPQGAQDHAHGEFISVGIHDKNFLFTRQKLVYGIKE